MKTYLSDDLRSLTSFRFFAAYWVFLFHLRSRIDHESTWFWDIVENGARGVDFFFILSGFVIFHVYERQIVSGRFSFRNYMVKRFARIYPLHLVMLLVFLALAIGGDHRIQGVLASVSLLHAWGLTDGLVLNGPSWTLSAEMFVYLVFGVVAFRSPPTWLLAAAFLVTALCAHAFSLQIGKTAFIHLTWDYGSIRILPLFILGMLLKRLLPLVSPTLAAAMGVLGIAAFCWVASREAGYEILVPFVLLIVAGAGLSDLPMLPTNSRLLVHLGEISYSTYMIHILVISIWFDYLPKLGLGPFPWPFVCIAVIAGSLASYHLVEVPARTWINGHATPKPRNRAAVEKFDFP